MCPHLGSRCEQRAEFKPFTNIFSASHNIILNKTGNVLKSVQPLLQWKSNWYFILWMCVCVLSYLAGNAHAPFCHLLSVRLYYIFPHYLALFLENLSRKFQVSLKFVKNKRCFTWRHMYSTFLICFWIHRRMRNVSQKLQRKKHTFCVQ